MRRTIHTDAAPDAIGAYNQATETDSLVFTAGQVALTPDGELLDDESTAVQTERALENIAAILEAADTGLENVVKVTVFLDDIEKFDEMNEAYAGFFDEDPPARSAVEVANLPAGAAVEIEAVAAK